MKAKSISANACIGLFTPSEPLTGSRQKRVAKGVRLLETYGYSAAYAPNALARTNYMAGTLEQRVADIHELIADRNVELLMATWGGKSACQLVPFLDYQLIARSRKPICYTSSES